MICHDPPFVFIHIPKTAGISIYDYFKAPRAQQHHNRLFEHYGWDECYFKFAFVRNPWDRFLSCYTYFRNNGRGTPADRFNGSIVHQFDGFASFVRKFSEVKGRFVDHHFYPQSYWMDDRLDFVGRYENLHSDFEQIVERLGFDAPVLKQLNSSDHDHYTSYYQDDTADIVRQHYAVDIERFGYQFGS